MSLSSIEFLRHIYDECLYIARNKSDDVTKILQFSLSKNLIIRPAMTPTQIPGISSLLTPIEGIRQGSLKQFLQS